LIGENLDPGIVQIALSATILFGSGFLINDCSEAYSKGYWVKENSERIIVQFTQDPFITGYDLGRNGHLDKLVRTSILYRLSTYLEYDIAKDTRLFHEYDSLYAHESRTDTRIHNSSHP
jgi:hypothetical protein